jgi:hypothetical protein
MGFYLKNQISNIFYFLFFYLITTMYKYEGNYLINYLKIPKIKLIVSYKAEYYLDWTSIHYGEDEIQTNQNSYFHSGPQNINVQEVYLKLILKNKTILKIKTNKKYFNDIIQKSIKQDANQKYC